MRSAHAQLAIVSMWRMCLNWQKHGGIRLKKRWRVRKETLSSPRFYDD